MASENQTYPQIPNSAWWSLRKKLHQSLPKEISVSYLETALGLGPSAAKKYLNPIKRMGLIGDDGKPTERAVKWRGDQEDYATACKEIINDIFPDELNDAIHNPREEKDNVIKWFMNKLRIGNGAATNLATFYILLREADLSKEPDNSSSPKAKIEGKAIPKNNIPVARAKASGSKASVAKASPNDAPDEQSERKSGFQPKIHIDVQIHISPESTADQIDQIFASMAKHLVDVKP